MAAHGVEEELLDVTDIAELLADNEFLEEDVETVAAALAKGAELKAYSQEVEGQLKEVETASIEAYIREDENLKNLHKDIRSCDAVLARMEHMLGGFHSDLSAVSEEIRDLQTQSRSLNLQLNNRRKLEGSLGQMVEQMVIPPELAKSIFHAKMDEKYIESLADLRVKLAFAEAGAGSESRAFREMTKEIGSLRSKAVLRTREWLLTKINLLKKPQTNIQQIQSSVLFKYRDFYEFLAEVAPDACAEVVDSYSSTMDKLYADLVKTYAEDVMKLSADAADSGKGEVMAQAEEQKQKKKKKKASTVTDASRSVYSITGRSAVLEGLDKPYLTTEECSAAAKKRKTFPFEVAWRSISLFFVDVATSESLFCNDFFGEVASTKIFERCVRSAQNWLQDTLRKRLTGSQDGISMLLLVALNAELQKATAAKGTHALDPYFDLTNITLWPMFKKVLDAHLDSLKNVDVNLLWKGAGHVEPHEVTERFREFSFSCLTVEKNEMSEQMMAQNMATFRNGMADFLNRTAGLFSNSREKRTFLINNTHHILACYYEGGLTKGDDYAYWETWRSNQVSSAVNDALSPATHPVLAGLEKYFSVQDKDDGDVVWSEKLSELEELVHTFAKGWQAAVAAIAKAVSHDFSWSESLQHYVLEAAFDRLRQRCDRFDAACEGAGLHSSMRQEIVSKRDLHFEIKKFVKTPDLRASMMAGGGRV